MTRLEFMRQDRKMTQQEMARLTGIHRTTCSQICNDWFTRIHPNHLEALQRVFGDYTFEQFMEEVGLEEKK